jgi:hypothetical protein
MSYTIKSINVSYVSFDNSGYGPHQVEELLLVLHQVMSHGKIDTRQAPVVAAAIYGLTTAGFLKRDNDGFFVDAGKVEELYNSLQEHKQSTVSEVKIT